MVRYNIVGHYFRPLLNSDKIYILGIRKTGNEFAVMAKWGRRGNSLSNQVKGNFQTIAQASECVEKLWKGRLSDGYMDIESDEYVRQMKAYNQIPLTLNDIQVSKNLEDDLNFPKKTNNETTPSTSVDITPSNMVDMEETMICNDNTGLEDHFDVGIEYVVEPIKQPNGLVSNDMIAVYDKLGRLGEFFKNRFINPTKVGTLTNSIDEKIGPKDILETIFNSINEKIDPKELLEKDILNILEIQRTLWRDKKNDFC
ncbi:MAG: WGR domain-containing protein [Smithella sp.]